MARFLLGIFAPNVGVFHQPILNHFSFEAPLISHFERRQLLVRQQSIDSEFIDV
jgi:hypothetical protein